MPDDFDKAWSKYWGAASDAVSYSGQAKSQGRGDAKSGRDASGPRLDNSGYNDIFRDSYMSGYHEVQPSNSSKNRNYIGGNGSNGSSSSWKEDIAPTIIFIGMIALGIFIISLSPTGNDWVSFIGAMFIFLPLCAVFGR